MFENNSKKTYTLDDYPVTYIKIGDGFTAIDNTVKKMIEVINESAKNIRIRSKASDIIKDVPERDKYGECDAIYNWTRDNSRYTKDIDGEETLQSPIMALDLIDKGLAFQADCDDYTMLCLSLLKSIGYPVGIRIVGYGKDKKYTHVYGLVYLYDEWLPVDAIQRDVPIGWEHDNITCQKDYEV